MMEKVIDHYWEQYAEESGLNEHPEAQSSAHRMSFCGGALAVTDYITQIMTAGMGGTDPGHVTVAAGVKTLRNEIESLVHAEIKAQQEVIDDDKKQIQH